MSKLSKDQRQEIKAKLAQRKSELVAEIREELKRSGHEHFADLAGEVTDAADSSVADMLVDRDIAIISAQVGRTGAGRTRATAGRSGRFW